MGCIIGESYTIGDVIPDVLGVIAIRGLWL